MFILVGCITVVIVSFIIGIVGSIILLSDEIQSEQEPCASCEYTEGSEWCLEHCPYDADNKTESYNAEK